MKMEIRLALWIKRIVTRHRFGGVFSLRMCRDRAKILAVLAMALMLMSPLTAYAVGEGNLDGGGGSMDREPHRTSGRPAWRREGDGHPGGYQDPGNTAH